MKRIITLWFILMLTGILLGQSAETLPSFEAADVRVSAKSSNPQTAGGFVRGQRYQFRNATMLDLISSAYGIEAEKVLGGPVWLESDRFDIIAKTPPSTTNDTAKLMLRSLLADRFKLVVREEDKPANAYVLTSIKRGPQLKESAGGAANCQGVPQNPPPGTVPYQVVACKGMTMAAFAQVLRPMASAYIDQPVVDMTSLDGAWDFEIKWTGRGALAAAGADGITIFDALEKQLGLKLELQKRSMKSIVVDRVNQKPTDNVAGIEKLLPAVSNEFEVADVKPTAPDFQGRQGNIQPNGRIDLRGPTLKELIMLAWDIPQPDLVSTPKWAETTRFDLVARAPADVSMDGINVDVDTLRAMLRTFLIDRFKMKLHTENQPLNVYALLAARREPRLKQGDPTARATCKRSVAPNATGLPQATLACQNTTMAQLAEKLPGTAPAYVDRPAIDKTGLEGGWDFALNWTPRGAFEGGGQGGPGGPGPGPGAGAAASDPNGGLSVFEGLERLGLKLELQKHPTPVLVFDQIVQDPVEK